MVEPGVGPDAEDGTIFNDRQMKLKMIYASPYYDRREEQILE